MKEEYEELINYLRTMVFTCNLSDTVKNVQLYISGYYDCLNRILGYLEERAKQCD